MVVLNLLRTAMNIWNGKKIENAETLLLQKLYMIMIERLELWGVIIRGYVNKEIICGK